MITKKMSTFSTHFEGNWEIIQKFMRVMLTEKLTPLRKRRRRSGQIHLHANIFNFLGLGEIRVGQINSKLYKKTMEKLENGKNFLKKIRKENSLKIH